MKKVKALDDSQEGIMLATDQDGSTSAFAMVPFNRYVKSVTSANASNCRIANWNFCACGLAARSVTLAARSMALQRSKTDLARCTISRCVFAIKSNVGAGQKGSRYFAEPSRLKSTWDSTRHWMKEGLRSPSLPIDKTGRAVQCMDAFQCGATCCKLSRRNSMEKR